jgi:hypothetical protein
MKLRQSVRVTKDIPFKLRFPKSSISRRRRGARATRMPVPKTPMNEYNASQSRKHKVGSPRKIAPPKTETEAEAVRNAPYFSFRYRISAAHGRHDF